MQTQWGSCSPNGRITLNPQLVKSPRDCIDYVILHDTGAYYFSNPFYYNALCAPAVYAADALNGESVNFAVWRLPQSMDDMLAVIG